MVEYGLYTLKKNMTMGIWKYLEFLIVSDLGGLNNYSIKQLYWINTML